MRNPDRIDDMLDAIRAIWKEHPDWRFTQLLWNVGIIGYDAHGDIHDPYNDEDDSVFELLKRYK